MQRFRRSALMLLATGSVALAAACGSGGSSTTTVTQSGGQSGGTSSVLIGAGSTLVAPLVSQWEADYLSKKSVTITYGAVGSGGGIDAITSKSVDFGASDAPFSSDQAAACKSCIQIPWVLAAVVPSYHLDGAPDHLKLTGKVLADMFLGKITAWNDPAIKALNPGVNLPSTKVTPVYRSDGSGDSYAFTNYLSAVDPEWKSKVGVSTQPSFPTGTGEEHSSGVAAQVQSTNGGITYVTLAYVITDKLQSADVQNAAGNYPVAGIPSIRGAAAAVSTINPDGSITLVNPPASAAQAWPIATYSYVMVPTDSSKGATLRDFLTYAISSTGQAFGPPLDFAALPPNIVAYDTREIAKIS
jgi:phosphate transport system substrate-binding protein